jgi:hypothetical protein
MERSMLYVSLAGCSQWLCLLTLRQASQGQYLQIIYPEAGLIIPYYVYSPSSEARKNRIAGDIVPLEKYSDVLFLEYDRLCQHKGVDVATLKYYLLANVENYPLWSVALTALNRARPGSGTMFPPWEKRLELDMSSVDGKAILASPMASSLAWMLVNHKEKFGRKTISKVWDASWMTFIVLSDHMFIGITVRQCGRYQP